MSQQMSWRADWMALAHQLPDAVSELQLMQADPALPLFLTVIQIHHPRHLRWQLPRQEWCKEI